MSQKQETQFDSDTLTINVNGHVEGQAVAFQPVPGYDVSVSVTSYDYERNGETKTNHVPHVTLSTIDGNIVAEPHAHDSHIPAEAIKEGKQTARYVIENIGQFVDN